MDRLLPIRIAADILPGYSESPIGLLLEYRNIGRPFEAYDKARLLVEDNKLYPIKEK